MAQFLLNWQKKGSGTRTAAFGQRVETSTLTEGGTDENSRYFERAHNILNRVNNILHFQSIDFDRWWHRFTLIDPNFNTLKEPKYFVKRGSEHQL